MPSQTKLDDVFFIQEKQLVPGRTFTFLLPSGISVVISIFQTLFQINIVMAEGTTTSGLLGTFNGNSTDDLLAAEGVTLPISSSMASIHYGFGESCRLITLFIR